MAKIRFYAPLSDGAFQDVVDDLAHAGVACTSGTSSNFQRCSSRGARYIISNEPDQLRVQLLDEGGLGARAWDAIDSILLRATSPRTSGGVASGGVGGEFVGGITFFDPELMKYGNAISPFSIQPSYEVAQRMMSLPLADRYGDRAYQPWWGPSYDEGIERPRCGHDEDEGEYVGALEAFEHVGAAFDDPVNRYALVATATVAGLATLIALRHLKHLFEIAAVGLAGAAFAWRTAAR
jgi:hypothetical protein